MRLGPAFATGLVYVPLRRVSNVPATLKKLTVAYSAVEENYEDEYAEATEAQMVEDEHGEVQCYDLSVRGYIGLPRAYARKTFPGLRIVDRTVDIPPNPALFEGVKRLTPRDALQKDFWERVAAEVRLPGFQDIVANAETGTGKTIMALWLQQEVLQAPLLVTVPNNYLRAQWVDGIAEVMGKAWARKYVGHVQQDIMDYEGRLITVALAPSLARRNYPLELRRAFAAAIFDEWHKIGAPKMSLILHKYPPRVRIGLTATNRRDVLKKVADLHLGPPKVVSKQKGLSTRVYIAKYEKTLNYDVTEYGEFYITSMLAKLKDRNHMLSDLIFTYGWQRDRHVVALSDRTDQLLAMQELLMARGVPGENIGILCGEYKGYRFDEYRGKMVPTKIKMTQEEKDTVAGTCNIILTTWGQFDTGSNIPRLDMGVELTPRSNLDQGIGRLQRIAEGKAVPEWYGIDDKIYYKPAGGASIFADPRPVLLAKLEEVAANRLSSYGRKQASVQYL